MEVYSYIDEEGVEVKYDKVETKLQMHDLKTGDILKYLPKMPDREGSLKIRLLGKDQYGYSYEYLSTLGFKCHSKDTSHPFFSTQYWEKC